MGRGAGCTPSKCSQSAARHMRRQLAGRGVSPVWKFTVPVGCTILVRHMFSTAHGLVGAECRGCLTGSRRRPHAVEMRCALGVRLVVHALRAVAARRRRLFKTRKAQHANGRLEGLQRRLVQTRVRCYEGATQGDGNEDHQPPQHLLLRATSTPPCREPILAMEPRVQPQLGDVIARYFFSTVLSARVSPADVIIVIPHDCATSARVHAWALPIASAQTVESSSTATPLRGQLSVCL